MTDENDNEVYKNEFDNLVTKLTDIKQIKPGNQKIREYYNDHLSVEEKEKTENDIDPYYRIKQLESNANEKSDKEKDKAIKIIKSLELLVEDPYDNFNIKNFVQEYQKVHNIDNGEGHTKGKINRNETYTTDYYAMPYDGTDGVQHNKKHQDAYTKRGELIEAVKELKNAGKTLKKDVTKSKLKPEHKKEIYNIIDGNNKLILEYDSTKTKEELSNLLENDVKKLKKLEELKLDGSGKKTIEDIINELYTEGVNPFKDNNNNHSLTTYDTKLDTVKKFYTNDYTTGSDKVAMNPQDESDYMYSVTYKSEDKGQKYADIFGIETIFRILRLTGSNIIPDSDKEKEKKHYDVFNNYYKVDQKTKNPVYVSEYNKESIWNTKLLDPK